MAHITLAQYQAQAMILDATSPPARGMAQHRPYLAFASDATEIAFTAAIAMPGQYGGSGTLKASIGYYMTSNNTSKTIDWEVSIEAVADGYSYNLSGGTAFDDLNEITDGKEVPATLGYLDVAEVTLANKDTMADTPVEAGDMIRLKIARDHDDADDDAAGDACLLWVELWEET